MAKFAKITYGTQGQSKEYTYVVNDNVRVGSFIEPAFKHFPDGKICSTIGIVQSTAKEATAKGKQFKEELGGKDVVKAYTGKELGIDKERDELGRYSKTENPLGKTKKDSETGLYKRENGHLKERNPYVKAVGKANESMYEPQSNENINETFDSYSAKFKQGE